jgi:iron complex transport system ATP-binding protein
VLQKVSFNIARGEMLGGIGPNGSGKTTLIGLISGLLRAGSGEVEILGRRVGEDSRRELSQRVAVVPQATGTVFPYTAGEIVAMGRYPHLRWPGWMAPRDREICTAAMRRTATEAFRDRTLDQLSAGERQRVLIARALAQGTEVLLLDEASSFLDIGQELRIFRMLDGLRREEGLVMLAVSHDLNLVGTFCQRTLLLKDGEVLAEGPLAETMTGENLSALFDVEVEADLRPEGRVRVTW